MDLSIRNTIRAAVIALAVGLAVNVYGITGDIRPYQWIAVAVLFVCFAIW